MSGVQKPEVSHQMRIADGGFEIDKHTESDLADWGFVEKGSERETRYLEPKASEFGEDDRTEVKQSGQTEQETLVLDVDDDQMTLSGEEASGQANFE